MLEAEKRELIARSKRKVDALHLELEAVRGAWTEATIAHGRLLLELYPEPARPPYRPEPGGGWCAVCYKSHTGTKDCPYLPYHAGTANCRICLAPCIFPLR